MDKIDELLTRGVENIISNKEELAKLLTSGKKLNVYFGIDPTATHIHIGNAVGLRKLQSFVELGHNVTFLIGSFTALIGDTSDKSSERPVLTQEQIEENFKDYKSQAEKVLDFSKVTVVHNGDWLKDLNFKDIISLCQHFALGDFISRELIRERLASGTRVRLDEMLYPVMQGYDCYHLDADIQIGGPDQTFNMQAGRTLQKDLRGKDTFVMANGYLEGTDGRKMSKTWNNAIWLDDSPVEMFGKVMSAKDELIISYFKLATNLPLTQIAQIEEELAMDKNPMLIKKTLARQIVRELHSEEAADEAQRQFELTFQQVDLTAAKIPTFAVSDLSRSLLPTVDLLMETQSAESKTDAKRLIEQGAVELNDQKVEKGSRVEVKVGDVLKIGKKRFLKFV